MSENVPEHCPGTQSEDAGKASACAGCPNQNICSSGEAKGPDPGIAQVRERLANVKHKVLILSGKGGVGKSTLTALLGRALAAKFPDKNVGVLDVDICGPSQPRVMGAAGEQVHHSGSGWSPVYIEDNLSLMSIGFLLGSVDDAIIWRGPKKNGMIKQFLTEVDWGQLDYLLIDTPPGTSDEHLSLVTYLGSGEGSGLAGAVLVTTPQELSLLDVRKEISFCKKVGVPIIGLIENMSSFICPKCKTESEIFPMEGGNREGTGIRLLGRLPLDPRLARCCDDGKDPLVEASDSPAIAALNTIVEKFLEECHT